jgi:short-subunit dehydrogenase
MKTTALVTGASGGIGLELARLLASAGSNLLLVARTGDRLAAAAQDLARTHGIEAAAVAVDLARPDAVDRIVEEAAARGLQIDVLVNNAGVGSFGAFVDTPPGDQLRLLQINVVALTALTSRLLPGMVARRRGRVLNVASTAAFQPGPLMAVYYASKAYVLSLSEALSNETAGTGVTVTCLCPGPTRTDFHDRAGLQNSRLFSSLQVMDAAAVAAAGYDGMMAGRAVVIPGIGNKLGVQMLRIAPRALVRRIVRRIQDRR